MQLRWIRFLILFGFGLFLALASSFWNGIHAQESDSQAILTSPVLLDCVPDLKDIEARRVIAFVQDHEKSYYVIVTNPERLREIYSEPDSEGGLEEYQRASKLPPRPVWQVTVSIDAADHCEVLVPRQIETFRPLTELMSEDAARQLTLQEFKFDAEVGGGLEALQKRLNELSKDYRQGAGSGQVLQPYEVWAYQQLGLNVPDNIPVAKPGESSSDQAAPQPTESGSPNGSQTMTGQ